MEMKQNQTSFHGTYLNLTAFSLSKYIKVFQWLWKSEFLSFMTNVNPNNGNKQIQIFFHGAYSNLTVLKYLNDFQIQSFSILRLKWTEKMEVKQCQTFFRWTKSNMKLLFIGHKILNFFNDFFTWHFSISL